MAGLPGVDSLATYGGAKVNEHAIEDATAEEDAAERNLMACNVAGSTQTLPRAIRRFIGHGTTPTDPVTGVHYAVWGNELADKPVVANAGTGIYTITWPTTVTDELGETHDVNLVDGWANVKGSTLYHVQVDITSPNVATVYVFNAASAPNNAVGVTLAVYVR